MPALQHNMIALEACGKAKPRGRNKRILPAEVADKLVGSRLDRF